MRQGIANAEHKSVSSKSPIEMLQYRSDVRGRPNKNTSIESEKGIRSNGGKMALKFNNTIHGLNTRKANHFADPSFKVNEHGKQHIDIFSSNQLSFVFLMHQSLFYIIK